MGDSNSLEREHCTLSGSLHACFSQNRSRYLGPENWISRVKDLSFFFAISHEDEDELDRYVEAKMQKQPKPTLISPPLHGNNNDDGDYLQMQGVDLCCGDGAVLCDCDSALVR